MTLAGCNSGQAKEDPDIEPSAPKAKPVAANWPKDIKIHRNAKGDVECPVMKSVVASPEKAVDFQDYKGVRYYFCCDGCPEPFKADPQKYAEK